MENKRTIEDWIKDLRFAELQSILEADQKDGYLYQKRAELMKQKDHLTSLIEKQEKSWSDEQMFRDAPGEEYRSDPLAQYICCLKEVGLLCRVIAYKCMVKSTTAHDLQMDAFNAQWACTKVLQEIRKNPRATYGEIVGRNIPFQGELAIEVLIEDGNIQWVRSKENQGHKDSSCWRILREPSGTAARGK